MTVSTHSRSASRPASACIARFLPSNLNGLVTTAIVSAPSSLARLAITGAAPVPVPPPRPVVTKIMSAPDSAWMIESVSSSAACRPMLGSAPAPSPFVSFWPIWILTAALLWSSAWTSVLATMNSTPPRPTVDHPVDGVAAAAADADHLDLRAAPRLRDRASAAACRRPCRGHRHVSCQPPIEDRPPGESQKNSLKIPRSRPAMRPNAPAPTRAGSGTRLRCAYSTSPTGVANVGLFT